MAGVTDTVMVPTTPEVAAWTTAAPSDTAVTIPPSVTVATPGSEVVQANVALSALPWASRAVAVPSADCPSVSDREGGDTETDATEGGFPEIPVSRGGPLPVTSEQARVPNSSRNIVRRSVRTTTPTLRAGDPLPAVPIRSLALT